jgi:prevent-host-death family protein
MSILLKKRPIEPLLRGLQSVSASTLKNHYGRVAEQAARGPVTISRYKVPEMVLLPAADYVEMQRARQAPLDALAAEFDLLVVKMNTPKAKTAAANLFRATPKELGRSAVKFAQVAKAHAR